MPEKDLHLSDQTYSQTHYKRHPAAFGNAAGCRVYGENARIPCHTRLPGQLAIGRLDSDNYAVTMRQRQ
jgi:hypothetical protein